VTETYTLRGIQSMLGLSRGVIAALVDAGFVTPTRGKRGELRFSFQDVVLLRTAHGLQQAQIPPRKILRSLRRLKDTLPEELPLTGLRITAVGNDVAVKEGDTQWQADSGQMLIDFEVRPAAAGNVALLVRREPQAAPPAPADDPTDWYHRAVQLEPTDPKGAEAAYRQAMRLAPDWADPYLNLGVVLCESGRTVDAVLLYQEALQHCPQESLLHFNLAVALEDLDEPARALAHYEACMALAPRFADAHFNAARLHEQLGHATKAIRHYSEYRRLQRRP
jgi:tetratricopeptide (TPR) repeat protein